MQSNLRRRRYSNDTARRGPANRPNNYPQSLNRRWISNPVAGTPRQISRSGDPIYVYNSQDASPSQNLANDRHMASNSTGGRPTHAEDSQRILSSGSSTGSQGFSTSSRAAGLSETQPIFSESPHSRQKFTNDVRNLNSLFPNDPKAVTAPNGSCTYFYDGVPRQINRSEQSNRTVYVYGVDQFMFVSHEVKEMMMQCGEVESISYLPGKYKNSLGQCFVA
jgi:hypothetical protein